MSAILKDLTDEAERLTTKIQDAGLNVKLLGGLAIWFHSPAARTGPLKRSYGDLDFVGSKKEIKSFIKLMVQAGYLEDKRFNAIHGATRLILLDEVHQRPVDVLIDKFKMCHEIELTDRLLTGSPTIPLADLLLTKLQVAQLNQKDVVDIAALLLDQDFGSTSIDIDYIVSILSNDWGFEHTVLATLANLPTHLSNLPLDQASNSEISKKIEVLKIAVNNGKKSFTYKIREKIGEKMPWAEEPEDLIH